MSEEKCYRCGGEPEHRVYAEWLKSWHYIQCGECEAKTEKHEGTLEPESLGEKLAWLEWIYNTNWDPSVPAPTLPLDIPPEFECKVKPAVIMVEFSGKSK